MLPRGFPFGLRRSPPSVLLSAISSSVIVYKRHGFFGTKRGHKKIPLSTISFVSTTPMFSVLWVFSGSCVFPTKCEKTVKVSQEYSRISLKKSTVKQTRCRCGKHELFSTKVFRFRVQDLSTSLVFSKKYSNWHWYFYCSSNPKS